MVLPGERAYARQIKERHAIVEDKAIFMDSPVGNIRLPRHYSCWNCRIRNGFWPGR